MKSALAARNLLEKTAVREIARQVVSFSCVLTALAGCGPAGRSAAIRADSDQKTELVAVYNAVGGVTLGEPLAVTVDLRGDAFVADGLPGRVVLISSGGLSALEFQEPARNPSFYPSDIKVHGFFLYVIDEPGRTLLRFDKDGAYRDLLLNFNEEILGRRVSPYGLDVDGTGRIAVTDIENHRVLVFDSYLSLEVAFGSYGSYAGQLDTPEGVSFTEAGDLVVADSGNMRVEFFGPGGDFQRAVPREGEDNPFGRPRRAVTDVNDNTYVADPEAGRVFVFDSSGRLARSLFPDGAAQFEPTDIEVTRSGMIYVTDAASRSLFAFKVMSY